MAEPTGQQFEQVALGRSADAEFEGLDLVGLAVLTAEPEKEARNIELLDFLRVLEFRTINTKLVLNVETGGNECASGSEGSGVEARGFGFFHNCHDYLFSSGRPYLARASCRCFSVNLPSPRDALHARVAIRYFSGVASNYF